MKTRILLFILNLLSLEIVSQHVGIGTTTPTYPLTVEANGPGIVQKSGDVKIGFYSSSNGGAWMQTYSGHSLRFTTNDAPFHQMILTTSGNIGIGEGITPEFKLDVDGRMRLRNPQTGTAGVWIDGVNQPLRSFIGMHNSNHVGIYGDVTGWNFVMNVENGNTGIGTNAPTSRLDVNGNIRIRGSFPKAGSVFTSGDADGSGEWMDPVAFRVSGLLNGSNVNINEGVWTKLFFNTTASFNLGLNYQPVLSQFLCAEKGIYEFNVQISYNDTYSIGEHIIRLMIDRNGVITEFTKFEQGPIPYALQQPSARLNYSTGAAQLLPGDKIWVETYVDGIKVDGVVQSSATLLGNGIHTWFTGHMIARN